MLQIRRRLCHKFFLFVQTLQFIIITRSKATRYFNFFQTENLRVFTNMNPIRDDLIVYQPAAKKTRTEAGYGTTATMKTQAISRSTIIPTGNCNALLHARLMELCIQGIVAQQTLDRQNTSSLVLQQDPFTMIPKITNLTGMHNLCQIGSSGSVVNGVSTSEYINQFAIAAGTMRDRSLLTWQSNSQSVTATHSQGAPTTGTLHELQKRGLLGKRMNVYNVHGGFIGHQLMQVPTPMAMRSEHNGNVTNSQSSIKTVHSTKIRRTNPPFVIAHPHDEHTLSAHQFFLRLQIEAFEATDEDINTHVRGRNKPITIGQIGLRCRHCSHIPAANRMKGSVYFPANTKGMYQAAQNMSTSHIQCGMCPEMPESMKEHFKCLIAVKSFSTGAGRPYWDKCAQDMGLVNTENGIFFLGQDANIKPQI